MTHQAEQTIATQALLKACHLCQYVQERCKPEAHLTKDDRSPVTVADFGAQAIVSMELERSFPEDVLLGEEDTTLLDPTTSHQVIESLSTVGEEIDHKHLLKAIARCNHDPKGLDRYWVLDPVDGTKGFLRGDQYAIALALIENGQVTLGLLGCPNYSPSIVQGQGTLFIAERENGCWLKCLDEEIKIPLKVSDIDDPRAAIFYESVESGHSSHSTSTRIMKTLGTTSPPYRLDSQAKYGAVSCGEASVYLRLPTSDSYEEKVWDHAAGSIIVEEAGGRVTDIFGNPLDFSCGRTLKNNRGIICTNGNLHDQVLQAIAEQIGH